MNTPQIQTKIPLHDGAWSYESLQNPSQELERRCSAPQTFDADEIRLANPNRDNPLLCLPRDVLQTVCNQVDKKSLMSLYRTCTSARTDPIILNKALPLILHGISNAKGLSSGARLREIKDRLNLYIDIPSDYRTDSMPAVYAVKPLFDPRAYGGIMKRLAKTDIDSPESTITAFERRLIQIPTLPSRERSRELKKVLTEISNKSMAVLTYRAGTEAGHEASAIHPKSHLMLHALDAMSEMIEDRTFYGDLSGHAAQICDIMNGIAPRNASAKTSEVFINLAGLFRTFTAKQREKLFPKLKQLWQQVPIHNATFKDPDLVNRMGYTARHSYVKSMNPYDSARLTNEVRSFIQDVQKFKGYLFANSLLHARLLILQVPPEERFPLALACLKPLASHHVDGACVTRYAIAHAIEHLLPQDEHRAAVEFSKLLPRIAPDGILPTSGTLFDEIEGLPDQQQIAHVRAKILEYLLKRKAKLENHVYFGFTTPEIVGS